MHSDTFVHLLYLCQLTDLMHRRSCPIIQKVLGKDWLQGEGILLTGVSVLEGDPAMNGLQSHWLPFGGGACRRREEALGKQLSLLSFWWQMHSNP